MDVSCLVVDNEDGSRTLSGKNVLDIAVARVYVWVELKSEIRTVKFWALLLVQSRFASKTGCVILTRPTSTGSGPVYSSMTKNWFQTQPRLDLWRTCPSFPPLCLCLCRDRWPASSIGFFIICSSGSLCAKISLISQPSLFCRSKSGCGSGTSSVERTTFALGDASSSQAGKMWMDGWRERHSG